MLQTSARLLALLTLLQQRREWTGPELAERLEVGPRTVRRDVDKLRELGYPIESARGVAGGYRLSSGTRMPPLLLDDAEAVAVAIGLRSAATGAIAGIEEVSVRALTKLEQILPARLRERVRGLGQVASAFRGDGAGVDADQLATISIACRDRAALRFAYERQDGERSMRDVEPVALVHSGSTWYLVAFDRDRDDWRMFRVDRVRDEVVVGATFPAREVPGGDPVAYVERQVLGTATGAGAVSGRVRVHAPAEVIERCVPASYATVASDGPDACIVTTVGRWSTSFVVWMAAMEEELTFLDPPELIAHVDGIARGLAGSVADRS